MSTKFNDREERSDWHCFTCLCNVCTTHKCPYLHRRFSIGGICQRNIMADNCPVTHCDYFVHKCKHKVYKVVRKKDKRKTALELLEEIAKKLEIELQDSTSHFLTVNFAK